MSRSFIRSSMGILAVLLLFGGSRQIVRADIDEDSVGSSREYQTKAAFLFNFAKFVEWPNHKFTQADSPLIIGVVGSDPFGGLLEEAAQDQRIDQRIIVVRHVDSREELRKCHIIFISRSETARFSSILSDVHSDCVLTVGESDKFINKGGMINFIMVGNMVRFEINDGAARHAGLKISSKLQQIALPASR